STQATDNWCRGGPHKGSTTLSTPSRLPRDLAQAYQDEFGVNDPSGLGAAHRATSAAYLVPAGTGATLRLQPGTSNDLLWLSPLHRPRFSRRRSGRSRGRTTLAVQDRVQPGGLLAEPGLAAGLLEFHAHPGLELDGMALHVDAVPGARSRPAAGGGPRWR